MRLILPCCLAILLACAAIAQKTELPLATFEGTVRSVDHKKVIVAEAENEMEFYLTRKTRVFKGEKEMKPAQLKTGDRVKVESVPHGDGTVDAAVIRVLQS